MSERLIRTSCRGCHGVCQVLVRLDGGGKVAGIIGDKDSPTSRGYICPKGARAAELVCHPDRLRRPLLRAGKRGAGRWEAIGWDRAVDLIAANFERIRKEAGPEYLAIAQGTGRPYTEFTSRFCHALGSPNTVGPGHNCFVPRNICAGITLGWFPQPDIYGYGGEGERGVMPACVMLFGSNTAHTGSADGYCGAMVLKAFRQARKTIVIDPRRVPEAKACDHHLAPRPGTECALLLAMIHTIIREKAFDAAFVERHCSGFDELARHVAAFTPDWAAGVARVPAAAIEAAALTFARTRPACLVWGNGVDESVNAFQTARATFILLALCGTLDVPGGMVRWVPPASIRCKSPMIDHSVGGGQFLSPEQRAKIISPYPFAPGAHSPSFWQACVSGKPYKPRGIWIIGSNPVLTQTRGDVIQSALRDHLEFVAVSDFFMTPTAAMADLVLPAAHWLEQEDVVYFHKLWCVLARKEILRTPEARDDRDVILDVARNMGLTAAFPWENRRRYLEWLLEPSGMRFEDFLDKEIVWGEMRYRKHETEGFSTPGGKVELYSSVMAKKGLPPLPVYVEPPVSPVSRPDLARDYPYILMTGCKILPFFHSEGRNQPALRKLHPKPLAQMHPQAAARAGLAQGQRVRVSTPWGAQSFFLDLDDSLPQDVVHAEHAWWFPEEPGPDYGCFTSNVNLLFPFDFYDQASGAESLKSFLCQVTAE